MRRRGSWLLATTLVAALPVAATACDATPPTLPADTAPAAIDELLTGPGGQDFLGSIATFDWADGGTEPGALFDWIARDATSPDAAAASRAGASAVAVSRYLSAHGGELLELPSGFLGTSHQTLGSLNPALTRSLSTTQTPYLAAMVCDPRSTPAYGLLDTAGCDDSVDAAEPVFTVLNTDRQAGQQLIDAANSEADRQVRGYAEANPTDLANPARGGLTYAGRLLGLAAVGARQSGIATRPLQEVVDEASVLIATAAIARGQGTMWPEFMVDGRLMSPDEVRARRGANRLDEYYGALNNYLLATGAGRALRDQLRGEYEKVAGHQ